MSRLLFIFRHPESVPFLIEFFENGRRTVELITEDQTETTNGSASHRSKIRPEPWLQMQTSRASDVCLANRASNILDVEGMIRAEQSAMTSSKTRVLIIDDDPSLARLMRLMLEKTQMYEVNIENRAANAMATARTFKPGVVLLDIDMPGKDGGQVAREMQGDPVLKFAKIIFITALVSKNDAGTKAAIRNGVRYLAKPVDPMTLIDTIEEVLASPTADASAGV